MYFIFSIRALGRLSCNGNGDYIHFSQRVSQWKLDDDQIQIIRVSIIRECLCLILLVIIVGANNLHDLLLSGFLKCKYWVFVFLGGNWREKPREKKGEQMTLNNKELLHKFFFLFPQTKFSFFTFVVICIQNEMHCFLLLSCFSNFPMTISDRKISPFPSLWKDTTLKSVQKGTRKT